MRGEQCPHAAKLRFKGVGLGGGDNAQVVNAVALALLLNAGEFGQLPRLFGHHELSALVEANSAFPAIGAQHVFSRYAEARLEGFLVVIEAGVKHFAVARTCAGANGFSRFKHQNLAASEAQVARNGQSHNAGANYHNVCLFHACSCWFGRL